MPEVSIQTNQGKIEIDKQRVHFIGFFPESNGSPMESVMSVKPMSFYSVSAPHTHKDVAADIDKEEYSY